MKNVITTELKNITLSDQSILIQGIGFDQRCLVILEHIDINKFQNIIGVCNIHSQSLGKSNKDNFRIKAGDKGLIIGETSRSMMELVDEFTKTLHTKNISSVRFFLDITAMSHELLVTLIGLFNAIEILNRTTFLYTSADQYGTWLSKGVSQVRSVLGFSGMMYPTKKTHLIVLTGFEAERAQDIISEFEPTQLSIGRGGLGSQSVSQQLQQINEVAADRLKQLIEISSLPIEFIHPFDFSCTNPFELKQQLLAHIKSINSNDFNIIIAPLNNKISTVGAALVALERTDIQICYAEAKEYNFSDYAHSSNKVNIFSIDE